MDLQQNLDLGILMDKKFMSVDYTRHDWETIDGRVWTK